MLTFLFNIVKKVILSSLLIYSFDVFSVSFGLIIPINFITVLIVIIFDVWGLMGLFLFSLTF